MSNDPPIDMILHCPKCHEQHIDVPDMEWKDGTVFAPSPLWANPPHRSHLCLNCKWVWRPADVYTNGVAAIKTKGTADSVAMVSPYVTQEQLDKAFPGGPVFKTLTRVTRYPSTESGFKWPLANVFRRVVPFTNTAQSGKPAPCCVLISRWCHYRRRTG